MLRAWVGLLGLIGFLVACERGEPPALVLDDSVALTDLMTTPALIEASGKLVGRVLDNTDVRGIVGRWYEACRADASIRAELVDFLDNW